MNRRPFIGILCGLAGREGETSYHLDRLYARAIEGAGGWPVLLPCLRSAAAARALLGLLDGLLLTGGTDVNPRRWGERKHPHAVLLPPEREESDFLAIREALRRDLPVLGICCGCQELNVALGGSIHQHLPDLPGAGRHAGGVRHAVDLLPGSRLRRILRAGRITVNSYHHQACLRLGRGLLIAARSLDGIVEAVESAHHRFAVGVQWHPERLPGDRRQQALFRRFVAEARRRPRPHPSRPLSSNPNSRIQ